MILCLLFAAMPVQGAWAFQATPEPGVTILAPTGGEALQGVVILRGKTQIRPEDIQTIDVSFAFESDTTGTWFLIEQQGSPANGDVQVNWDTTTITDGVYRLRVQVYATDGTVTEQVVDGLRVRNYSPVETSTPTLPPTQGPTPTNQTPTPGSTQPTATVIPTSTPAQFQPAARTITPLPTNPAQLTVQNLGSSAVRGIVIVLGAFLAALAYLAIRNWGRH